MTLDSLTELIHSRDIHADDKWGGTRARPVPQRTPVSGPGKWVPDSVEDKPTTQAAADQARKDWFIKGGGKDDNSNWRAKGVFQSCFCSRFNVTPP